MSSERLALQLAERQLQTPVSRVERLSQGVMNHMFRVETAAGEPFVVRIYPARRQKVARYEAQFVQRLRAQGCQVPEIISYSYGSESEIAHLIYRYIPGQTLAIRGQQLTAGDWNNIAGALIENLALIASCQVSGYGGLVNATSADDLNAWEFFHRSLLRGIENAESAAIMDLQSIQRLRHLLAASQNEVAAFDGAATWGDLAYSNIVIDAAGRLAGLVDFESCFALDRSLSVGYLYAISPKDPLLVALLHQARAAGFAVDDRRMKLCAVLRAARMARYAHTDLPSGVAQRPIATIMPGAMQALAELAGRG